MRRERQAIYTARRIFVLTVLTFGVIVGASSCDNPEPANPPPVKCVNHDACMTPEFNP